MASPDPFILDPAVLKRDCRNVEFISGQPLAGPGGPPVTGSKRMIRNSVSITPELSRQQASNLRNMSASSRSSGGSRHFTELGIVSAMWNEHCSYKSSKKCSKPYQNKGDRVIQDG